MLSRANLFAEFQGSINSGETEDRIAVTLAPQHVSLGDKPAYLSFHVEAGSNSPLDPAALRVQDSTGKLIAPSFSRHDVAGSKTSLVLAQLAKGNYTLIVNSQNNAKGVYRISVGLVGDVDGNHRVDTADADLIRSAYGAKQGSSKYLAAADTDMDGRITAFDLSQWRLNSSNTAQAASASSAAFESHAADAAFSGTVYDRVAALTPTAGYKANAPMKFYESKVGWVQPLESPVDVVSGVLKVPGATSPSSAGQLDSDFTAAAADLPPYTLPGDPSSQVFLRFKWETRHADYDNSLWYYVTDAEGKADGIAPDEPGYQAAALALGQQIFSSGQGAGAVKELSISSEIYIAFYVLQDGSSSNNVWFSVHVANKDDGYAHFQTVVGAPLPTYKVEDLSNNTAIAPNPDGRPDNDADFNDMVFSVASAAVNITADTTNDGTRNSTDDQVEEAPPGFIIVRNTDDDNGNSQADYLDAPFVDANGNPVNDDIDPIDVSVILAGLTLQDLNGYKVSIITNSPNVFKLWQTQSKQALQSEYIIGTHTVPTTIYIEGIATGQGTVKVELKKANGNVVASDFTTVTCVELRMTAHRPVSPPFAETAVPHSENINPGVGIRRNGDDDDADLTPDLSDTSVAGENDLIHVITVTSPASATGIEWVLSRDNAAINVYQNTSKGGVLLGPNTGNEVVINNISDIYVEWATMNAGTTAAGLRLSVRTNTNDPLTDDKVPYFDLINFHPYNSIVVAFGGNGQVPTDPPNANYGAFEIARDLYRIGYDVHMYQENPITPGYNEIVSAIQHRGVTDVAIFGYSQGGGATYHTANDLNNNRNTIGTFTIQFTAYIDAVEHTFTGAETDRPPGSAWHLNIYQPNDAFELGGGPMPAPASDEDLDATVTFNANLDHYTIDDDNGVQTRVRTRLQSHLNRW